MDALEGKTIVITGAASGIGLALANEAVRRGMRVLAADIDEVALTRAVAELERAHGQVKGVRVDVADAASVTALAAASYAHFGAVHVLINNAGIAGAEAAWNTPIEEYDREIRINLYGVIHGVRAFVPRMLESKETGHVVNIASAAGLFTVPGFAAYSASKFAVVGFSEALHHDLRARKADIHVSVVCPSWVRTNIVAGANAISPSDPVTTHVRNAVCDAVAHGIDASDVAKAVLDGVLAKQFYVLTHEDTRPAIHARTQDILEGRPPSSFLR
jgi:short-subunit dehydrogenase